MHLKRICKFVFERFPSPEIVAYQPSFPVIMQALSFTHANLERHAQHHLPNYGRERAPSSASLHPDLPLTRRRSSGGHLAQVALLQGGPPGPKGEPHHRSEEFGRHSFILALAAFSMDEMREPQYNGGGLGSFLFQILLDPKLGEF